MLGFLQRIRDERRDLWILFVLCTLVAMLLPSVILWGARLLNPGWAMALEGMNVWLRTTVCGVAPAMALALAALWPYLHDR